MTIKKLSFDLHQRALDTKQALIDCFYTYPKEKRYYTQVLLEQFMLYIDCFIEALPYRHQAEMPKKLNITLEEALTSLEDGVLEWGSATKHPSKKNYNHYQCAHFAIINTRKIANELFHQLDLTKPIGGQNEL